MPRRRQPAGPVRRADRGDVGLGQLGGRIDQHVRNVSIGQDALIQRGQLGSHDDGPGPSRRDQVRWTTDASRQGSASTTPRHPSALDVTPRRISTEYGLSRAVKTRSINRRPPANRLTNGRPGGTYLYWTRSRCTRARVAAETSARSLSTLDTVASDTPAASATVSRVGRPSLVTAPFLFGGPQLPWNRPAASLRSSNSKNFDARLIRSHEPDTTKRSGFQEACQVLSHEPVDADEVRDLLCSWDGSFVLYRKPLDGAGAVAIPRSSSSVIRRSSPQPAGRR